MRTTPHPPTISTRYMRSQRQLSAAEQRQLDEYLSHLRQYYEIPADQPVFPRTSTERSKKVKSRPTTSTTSRLNPASHPWKRPWGRP